MEFDAKKAKEEVVKWIKEWFDINGKDCNAVVGISGGKDSSVVAALCVEALGKDRVIGVLMPNGIQSDFGDAEKLVNHLGIKSYTINIKGAVDSVLRGMKLNEIDITDQTKINLPPRIRMSTLYAVSQSNNGRVANTCNLSETLVGYETTFGDAAGDFSPLGDFTVTEVKLIGRELGLPIELINKVPSDGLCGKTDEDKLGFTYDVLDKYIRNVQIPDEETKELIEDLYARNKFKHKLCNQDKFFVSPINLFYGGEW